MGKYLRRYGSDFAKKKRFEENEVISKIAFLSQNIVTLTDQENMELSKLQNRLDEMYRTKAEGAFIRSRQRWLEHGEQNSSYFFKLERHNSSHNTIHRLKIDGQISDSPKKIAQFCADFYKDLYSSYFDYDATTCFFDSLPSFCKINGADRNMCDLPLGLEEVTEAINCLKLNKSPGVDGLSSEFYKLFAKQLAPFLLQVFRESILKGSLPPSLTQGLITLLPKPKKYVLCLDNWRPICLLNNDYKINFC